MVQRSFKSPRVAGPSFRARRTPSPDWGDDKGEGLPSSLQRAGSEGQLKVRPAAETMLSLQDRVTVTGRSRFGVYIDGMQPPAGG